MRFSDFMGWWRQAFANYFFQSVITKPGQGETTLDVVLMGGEDGTDTEELTRLEQFGDVVIPPGKKNQCISIVSGAAGVTMSLADPSTRPTDGMPGDRGLYSNQNGTRIHLYGASATEPGKILITNSTGARVVIRQDGTVEVNSASGKNIVLNNGTKDNARKDDGVWAGVLKIVNSTDGMSTDKTEWYYTTKDPDDPFYPFGERKIFEWTGPLGSAIAPNPGAEPDGYTINLTGVITRGKSDVKS